MPQYSIDDSVDDAVVSPTTNLFYGGSGSSSTFALRELHYFGCIPGGPEVSVYQSVAPTLVEVDER